MVKDGTGIEELPSPIGHLNGLKRLNLSDCKSLRSLPTKIGMESLETLILSGCSNLKRFPEIDGKMKCLLELYLDGTGIEELTSSIGHLSNLVLLKLKDCSNIVSLPSSINGLKCLKTLNLFGCSKVETLPENLQYVEFLEELDLSKTAIRKRSSFIFQFKSLKVLSFNGCKGPPSKLRLNLASPFNASQRGSSDSMALMLPPLLGLSSLTKLNLSYCNLWEGPIPSDICCLSSLEELDLSGNNFIYLPATLNRLSKLGFLRLSDCRELKSLPELLSIEQVIIDGCVSLEVVADPTTVRNSTNWGSITGFNCYKLAEKNNALTILKKHLKVIANARPLFDIVIPGSKIPEWFPHQRDESSIKIPLPPNILNDSQWMGVAFCCIFVFRFIDDDVYKRDAITCKAVIHGRNIPKVDWSGFTLGGESRQPGVIKEFLWLRYYSCDKIFPFSLEEKCGKIENSLSTDWANQECNEIEFSIQSSLGVASIKVNKCDLDDIHQDIGGDEGSTGNDGVLVKRKGNVYEEAAGPSDENDSPEERPHPKRLEKILNFITRKKHSGSLIWIDQVSLTATKD
ncbi:disease resistance-like protein CSA1 [Durio zibethinus]|uniref:Disease resistance-like protein CSA1 n=1 Tax=Durio zibethinus TaxID=66656 RepID=A0A6P5Y593_DURZI|nr:disease resistance-like protein CSA1 [Durio zibethinus]